MQPDGFLRLGVPSISLAVKDLAQSKALYEKLGFPSFHGEELQNWLIMNNPGWDQGANPILVDQHM